MLQVSIIIPTLIEAGCLKRTLSYLRLLNPAPEEVIVVDSQSEDDTVDIALSAGVRYSSYKDILTQ